MNRISAEKLAQKSALAEPFANTRWYIFNAETKRIYYEGFPTKSAAVDYARENKEGDAWEADSGFNLNGTWSDRKAAGWILEPGRDRRGGARAGASRPRRTDEGRGFVPIYLDAPTILLLKAEAKRQTQANRAGSAVFEKGVASDLILEFPEDQWPSLLDCWETAGGPGHFTTLNISPPAAERVDEIIKALKAEMERRSQVAKSDADAQKPLKFSVSRAGVIRTLVKHHLED